MLYVLISVIVILLDQYSKFFIVHHYALHEQRSVIGNFFLITSERNKGAAFSILQNQRLFFLIITIVIVAAIVWYMRRTIADRKKILSFSLALILGGAVGNFIDRLISGQVVDFLQFNFHFHFFGSTIDYTFPIFNLADSAVVIGVSLLIIDSLWTMLKEGKTQQ